MCVVKSLTFRAVFQMKFWDDFVQYRKRKRERKRIALFIVHLCFGSAAFCALYLIFGFGAQLLCNIIGVVYPAYISIHAIESSSKLDDTKWLTYWVTFGILSIIEFFSGILTSVIPFYWLLKCVFLIWCMLPMEKNGSYVIYQRVVRPYFLKHHTATDKFIEDVVGKAKKSVGSVLKND